MSVHFHSSPRDWRSRPAEFWRGTTCVVIDALRATSTMATALANGATSVHPVREVESARNLISTLPGALLAGERKGLPLEGFDLGNSPLEFTRPRVEGRDIVLTTTNGTDALETCAAADHIFVLSLLNLEAVVGRIQSLDSPLHILAAGTGHDFSLEDAYVAARLLEKMGSTNPWTSLARAGSGLEILRRSANGRRLISIGMEADVAWCARENDFQIVPERTNRGYRIASGK